MRNCGRVGCNQLESFRLFVSFSSAIRIRGCAKPSTSIGTQYDRFGVSQRRLHSSYPFLTRLLVNLPVSCRE